MEAARVPVEKLIIGLALIAVGVAGFLGAIDVWNARDLVRLWPAALVIVGIACEIEALRRRRRNGGWVLIAIGVWWLAGANHVLGLTHRTGFSLAIAVAGAFIALHAIVDDPANRRKEKRNER